MIGDNIPVLVTAVARDTHLNITAEKQDIKMFDQKNLQWSA
jgi:hypothetical protein